MDEASPGGRQRQRLGPACDEQLAFLRDHGFAWVQSKPGRVMFGECWEASSATAAVSVCIDRRDGDFSASIGPPGHRGLDLQVVVNRLAVTKGERPGKYAKSKGAEAMRVAEVAAFLRGPAAPLLEGDFSAVQDLLGL